MNLNVLKGMLVILVVIDHNDAARSVIPSFLMGFSFHVVAFMTIPFLKPAKSLYSQELRDSIFGLYYPFALLVVGLSTTVFLTSKPDLSKHIYASLLALYSGDSDTLKLATHMALLWFLPAFISLTLIRSVIAASPSCIRAIAIVVLCTAHLFVGPIGAAYENYFPLGILPAIYIFPLAYFCVRVHRTLSLRFTPLFGILLTTVVFACIKWVQIRLNLQSEVGFLLVSDYRNPLALVVNDAEAVCGTLMMFQLARCVSNRFLEECGRASIHIYLIHAFIGFAVYRIITQVSIHFPYYHAAIFIVTVTLTTVLSLEVSRFLLRQSVVKKYIFPRRPADLFRLHADASAVAPQTASPADLRSAESRSSDKFKK